jgi:cobalt-zinc-cadmium efflux system membrane fusion protein
MRYAVVLFAVLVLAGCSREENAAAAVEEVTPTAPREVVLAPRAQTEAGLKLEQANVRSIPETLRATGRLTTNENRTWRVGAITEGRIVTVFANPGDRVRRGQVLARMHSHDIIESRAEYRRAVADLEKLKSAETYALRARDRARRLHALKAASLEQVEHAENELRQAQAAAANGAVEVERTRLHLTDFLQIPVQSGEDEEADLIPIEAPEAGVLLARNVTPGTVVAAGGEAFVITDPSVLWMMASITEENLSRVRVGQRVNVYVQAYGRQAFRGRIARLDAIVDPTTRTVQARVEVPNAGLRLRPEMYATAEIEAGGSAPAMLISADAPQEIHGQTSVFVRVAPDRFAARPVELGRTVGDLVEVQNGLEEGATIVTRGSFLLKSQLLKSTIADE